MMSWTLYGQVVGTCTKYNSYYYRCNMPKNDMKKTEYYISGNQTKNLNAVRKKAVTNASISRASAKNSRIIEYNANPNQCYYTGCNSIIPYDKRSNKFCSQSCSAKVSNESRDPSIYITTATKTVSCTKCNTNVDIHLRRSANKFICDACKIVYPHSKVHCTSCKFCNSAFYTNTSAIVCNQCQHLKWNNNKNQYSFKFNVFDYPDLFDLVLLQSIGWVSFGGRRGGNKNLSGISRDHKVSVSDAKKYNYDPYYISHPCNCELLPHHINNSKNTKSSISYEQLVELVTEYDLKLG